MKPLDLEKEAAERKRARDISAAYEAEFHRSRYYEAALEQECFLRDVLQSMPELDQAKTLPDWAQHVLNTSGGLEVDSRTFKSFERLVRSIPESYLRNLDATVTVFSGVISVYWDVPNCLTWVINPPEYRWPGVNVRVHQRIRDDRIATKAYSVKLAHVLIRDSFKVFEDYLGEDK